MQGIKIYTILASSLISGSVFAQTEISTSNSSTVNASYVEPSAEKIISPSDKLNNLFERNMSQPYIYKKLARELIMFNAIFIPLRFMSETKGFCCLMLRRVAVNIYYRQFVM